MATYGSWLDAQAGRGDEVGEVAKAWRDAQGRRPRASAYATIARWFEADGGDLVPGMAPERIEAVLTASLAQYHAGNHQAGPAVPSPPLGEDLQVKRLHSVPDHQQPDQAGDGETAGQKPEGIPIGVHVRLDQLDERLAGLQELVAAVPAIHELLVAFMQAMVPVIELAGELGASDSKLDSMAGEVRDLATQLGYAAEPDLIDSKPPMADEAIDKADTARKRAQTQVSPAQERARSVAAQNGWMPTMAQQASQPAVPLPPGNYYVGEDGAVWDADQGMRLYGGHIAPEPDWARYHDLGEPQ